MASGKAFRSDSHTLSDGAFQCADQNPAVETDLTRVPGDPQSAWREPTRIIDQCMIDDTYVSLPGLSIPFWGFASSAAYGRPWAPAIVRVRDQDLVQLRLQMPQAWLERCTQSTVPYGRPAPRCAARNKSGFIYQWRAAHAGTWLFQPHDATAHDFEMGLYGLLIVEPPPSEDGRRRVYPGGPSYDIERCLILDDVDPAWHQADFDTVQSRRRTFEPSYFLINGVPNTCSQDSPTCAVSALKGQRVLLRLMNASFSLLRVSLQGLAGEVVVIDGDVLGAPDRPWLKSKRLEPNEPLHLATGSRVDLLVDLADQRHNRSLLGSYPITFEFLDPRDRKVRNANCASVANRGTASTLLTVSTQS